MKYLKVCLLILICFVLFGCSKKYNITYDVNGGVMPDKYQETFKVNSDYTLPIPTKEGYFFLGWTESDLYINKLEAKDYNLKANWIKEINYNYIEDKEIFMQTPNEYLVYFMKDGCSWCAKIKDDVLRYQYYTSLEQYKENIKIFVVNLHTPERKSSIIRLYKGEDGEDGFFVEKAKVWSDLYIPSTPALIKINTNDNVRSAQLLERGATKIKNRLAQFLLDDKDYKEESISYSISYDLNGGAFNHDPINSFYGWSVFDLPRGYLEGYSFIGWYENDILVDKLELRDYHLKARYEPTMESLMITKEDIFHMEGEYYVLFVKYLHNLKEFITVINHYNTYAKARNLPYIYLIDLSTCNDIYRTYEDSDNGMFVDEAKEWDELYISERYTLISLSDSKESSGTKQAQYIIHNKEKVFVYLKEKYGFFI